MHAALSAVLSPVMSEVWGGAAGDPPPTPVTLPAVPMFILAGQSNANGQANSGLVTPYNTATIPNVRTYDWVEDAWQTLQINDNNRISDEGSQTLTGYFGAELSLGYHLAQRYGQEVYLIKQAKGGIQLAPASDPATTYDPGTPGSKYDTLTERILAAQAALEADGKYGRIEGIFWIQGESDGDNAAEAAAYQANLEHFIDTLRQFIVDNNCGAADVPFVLCPITEPNAGSYLYCDQVNDAQAAVTSSRTNVFRISDSGFTLIDEGAVDLHWDGATLQLIGRRLAEALPLSTSSIVSDTLQVMLDAMDYASLTFNSTTVSNWENRGAAGDAVQGSATYQPTYASSGINSKAALEFFGSADSMAIADSAALDYTRFYCAVVAQRTTDNGASQGIVSKFNTTGNQREFHIIVNASDAFASFASPNGTSTGTTVTSASTATTGTAFLLESWYDGTNLHLAVNGVEATEQALAAVFNGTATFVIGRTTGADFLGRVGEVRFHGDDLSETARSRTRAYMLEKWSIS